MKKLNDFFDLTRIEFVILTSSVLLVLLTYLIIPGSSPIALIAALIGCVYLIFMAKGNYFAFFLVLVYAILYIIESFRENIYSEIFNYAIIEIPFAILTIIEWKKKHEIGKTNEVKINKVSKKELIIVTLSTIATCVPLYFVFNLFQTEDLLLSIFAIGTHFLAAYLLHRRSKYYAISYIINDFIEIALWFILLINGGAGSPILVLYFVFLANDVYGFLNWRRLERKQKKE